MDKTSTGLFSGDNRQQKLPPGNRFGAKLHSLSSDDLKGTVARDCRPLVFFNNRPHMDGPLIHTLKFFRIRFRIRGDIRIFMYISAVGYSADSNFI